MRRCVCRAPRAEGLDGLVICALVIVLSSCAGCSNSEVLIFELKSNGAAELRRTLHGHDAPVTALAASNKHLVSADESGGRSRVGRGKFVRAIQRLCVHGVRLRPLFPGSRARARASRAVR